MVTARQNKKLTHTIKTMAKSKFKTGDNVRIISNEIQSNMVGKIGKVKKVYATFHDDHEFVYRVEVGDTTLKGVALEIDLELA